MLVEPETGLVIAGKYKLEEQIGEGGMSAVYRAHNVLAGRIVALKLLNPHQAGDAALSARFFREAQAVNRIGHPGIVDVLDAGHGETGPFIVMEYLAGESVARVLSRLKKLDLPAALATVLPVLDALHAAHSAEVVHRDLKPENIFYAADDDGAITVKLLDFGVAKALFPHGPGPHTSTGVVFGTPDYLSPEQASGEPLIDGRSDLFAVGVLLYELLTGVRPFHAPTTIATAYKIAHAKTPSLLENGGPDSPTLDAILARALAKRPEERYASAAELAAELSTLAPTETKQAAALRSIINPGVPGVDLSGVRRARATPTASHRTPTWPRRIPSVTPGRPSSPGRTPTPSRTPTPLGSSFRTPIPHTPTPARISRDFLALTDPGDEPGRATPTRSVPPRFVGRCHVRGLVVSAVDDHVIELVGESQRNELLATLDGELRRELFDGVVQAIVLYDLDHLTRYIDRISLDLFDGSPNWCRTAGHRAVGGRLAPMLRKSLRPARTADALRRLVAPLSQLFDFGSWEVIPGLPDQVRVLDFEAASLGLRYWLAGIFDAALAASDCRCQVNLVRGESSFSPQLVLEVIPR